MTYSDKLKDPRWQKKRLQILERDNWKCKKCSDEETPLHVHHLEYNGDPWETDNKYLVTLCEHCHNAVELFKNDCDFDKMKMMKLKTNDKTGCILFTSHNGICSMAIKDDKINSGFHFGLQKTVKDVIDIFTYTQNNGNL